MTVLYMDLNALIESIDAGIYVTIPVNSCGYYKLQVGIGAATNQDFNIEIARNYKFMVFNLVLYGDYLRAATTQGVTINQ